MFCGSRPKRYERNQNERKIKKTKPEPFRLRLQKKSVALQDPRPPKKGLAEVGEMFLFCSVSFTVLRFRAALRRAASYCATLR